MHLPPPPPLLSLSWCNAQTSLAAFDAEFVQSVDMQDYIVSLEAATSTLEKSMPLPPLGEHVTFLQNALVSYV